MRVARLTWALALAGCNQVYGLAPTQLIDGADGASDAPPLVLAADGTTMCPPAPDFETWTYQPVTGLSVPVEHATFLDNEHIVFGSNGSLYEGPIAGPHARIDALDLMDNAMLRSPSAAPDRDLFWFMRFQFNAGGPYYAKREAGQWTQDHADFGATAYQIQPGAAAYFGGTIRMVIAEQKTTSDKLRLVEFESHDGQTWQRLDTIAWSDGTSAHDFDPALSADGCLVFFRRTAPATKLFVAARGGAWFGPPAELVAADGIASTLGYPAIDPARTRLWFMRDNQIYEGHP